MWFVITYLLSYLTRVRVEMTRTETLASYRHGALKPKHLWDLGILSRGDLRPASAPIRRFMIPGANSQVISFANASPAPISRVGASLDQAIPIAFNHSSRHAARLALGTKSNMAPCISGS